MPTLPMARELTTFKSRSHVTQGDGLDVGLLGHTDVPDLVSHVWPTTQLPCPRLRRPAGARMRAAVSARRGAPTQLGIRDVRIVWPQLVRT